MFRIGNDFTMYRDAMRWNGIYFLNIFVCGINLFK